MTDYATLTDEELSALASAGNQSAELERRGRTLRPTVTRIYVCLHCGETIGRDSDYVERATAQPWVDPFKPGDVKSWYENGHWVFDCRSRRWWHRRPRTTTVTWMHAGEAA